VCCLLVLNSVTSTPRWIRQSRVITKVANWEYAGTISNHHLGVRRHHQQPSSCESYSDITSFGWALLSKCHGEREGESETRRKI
jgi:hypothetical protein